MIYFYLLIAVITVNIELPDGDVQCATDTSVTYHAIDRRFVIEDCPSGQIECHASEIVTYYPAQRVLTVGECNYAFFIDSFEEQKNG